MSEISKKKSYLTTTQAAKLLAVSPDTVLKWVKAGKLGSYRTLGGHFRIPLEALSELSQNSSGHLLDTEIEEGKVNDIVYQYCWEYMAGGGNVRGECRECITYKSRSKRCYELKDLPEGLGCLLLYCQSSCAECDYYKLVNDKGLNILIFSKSKRLIRDQANLDSYPQLECKFVESEYECSYIIEKFRPDYIVVDCAIGKRRTRSVCENFFNDPRVPVARIILSCRDKNLRDYCRKDVFGWIRKPFSLRELQNCIIGVS